MPWPTPIHIAAIALCAAAFFQLQRGGAGDPSAGHAKRMAKRNRTAIGIYARVVVRDAKRPQAGERLAGECLVQLNHADPVQRDRPLSRKAS